MTAKSQRRALKAVNEKSGSFSARYLQEIQIYIDIYIYLLKASYESLPMRQLLQGQMSIKTALAHQLGCSEFYKGVILVIRILV